VSRHHDFLEGVRAQLVDKDRRPVWEPATIEAVPAEATARILS
jgi:enoyl-CoA hydratase